MIVIDGGAADFGIIMFTLQQHVPALRNAAPKEGPNGKSENRVNTAQSTEQRPAADHTAVHCCGTLTSHRTTLPRNQRPGCVFIQSAKADF